MNKNTANIEKWLLHEGTEIYLGKHVSLKLAVLSSLIGSGESLAAVGRRFGVSRQAAQFHAQAARTAYGFTDKG